MIDPTALQPESGAEGPLVAVLTPRGRGAVASIRLRGDCPLLDQNGATLFRSVNGKPLTDLPCYRVVFGRWGSEPGEEVVVCRNAAETIDIHCHGGDAAVRRILTDLARSGCRIVSWQVLEVAAGSLFETECREALANASTLRTANILLEQCSGTLRTAIETLRDRLEQGDLADSLARVEALFGWAEFGRHLTVPWKVVILGRPNVGKSSLLNALAGFDRAIVWDEPGTTRDALTVETAFQGWPVRLVDTAGIRDAEESLESAGIARSRQEGATADCRMVVVDASQPPQPEDWELLAAWPESLVVAHKADLPDAWGHQFGEGAVRVSSLTRSGVDALNRRIVATLIPHVPISGRAIPVTARQLELLRRARAAMMEGGTVAAQTALHELLR